MNRSGFTTVEVMIASVLIIALVTAGTAGLRQMNILTQVAATRTAHTEVRSQVLAALNDSGSCAVNLGNVPVPANPVSVPIPQIKDGATAILINNQKSPSYLQDGLIYHLSLNFPAPIYESFNANRGRANATERYSARLEIRAERAELKKEGGSRLDLVGQIPLSVEIDQITRALVSCTVHAEDKDEVLAAGSTHTVRDCMFADGFPIPTRAGLICRIPVPYITQTRTGYPGLLPPHGIPQCSSLAGLGWTNVIGAGGYEYNTTLPVHQTNLPVCSGDPNTVDTGWHSMSAAVVEAKAIDVKKNAANTVSALLGGAAIAATLGNLIFPGLGFLIASILATFAFIFSLFHKCKKKSVTFYAQVTSVGCI